MVQSDILLVEDDLDGAEVVTWLLKSGGYEPIHASTAEDGLQLLNNAPDQFKIGIFDLALPGMDGFELVRHVRANPATQHMRLIAITAFHTPELRVQSLESGFDAYFAKPLDTAIFLGAFERIINS